MSISVFKDTALNEQLNRLGYVVISFLDSAKSDELLRFFQKTKPIGHTPFTTLMDDDVNYKAEVDHEIKRVLAPLCNDIFVSHVPFWGNFFCKIPSTPEMPLHADLQYVDEQKSLSLNIWCPLTDTDENNGALGVVPGSHKCVNQIRGTNITDAYRKNAKAIADKWGVFLKVKKGEAIVYDHRLLHYSAANQSSHERVAATLVMVPSNEPLLHYFAETEGDTTLYKYEITSARDLIQSGFLKRPIHLPIAAKIENYSFRPLTLEDFDTTTAQNESRQAL